MNGWNLSLRKDTHALLRLLSICLYLLCWMKREKSDRIILCFSYRDSEEVKKVFLSSGRRAFCFGCSDSARIESLSLYYIDPLIGKIPASGRRGVKNAEPFDAETSCLFFCLMQENPFLFIKVLKKKADKPDRSCFGRFNPSGSDLERERKRRFFLLASFPFGKSGWINLFSWENPISLPIAQQGHDGGTP